MSPSRRGVARRLENVVAAGRWAGVVLVVSFQV